ncbi:MAG TPA: HEAT repeat domain-containing protein [Bryobacteraceae bacterium]|jgi:hypothetical protein|nr:HEAT repeat domain-containing protein [Bryobacteraceae bacterium]
MARRDIEKELAALKTLDKTGPEEQERALRKALRDRVNLIVARAATMAGALQLRALIPDLCAAFERMLEKAAERDPQCWAKNGIAKALADLGHDESSVFIRGLRHVQMEPVWGRSVDTAFTLRGTCALALATVRDLPRREILEQLSYALTDSFEAVEQREREEAAPVRRDAVRAIESMGGEEPGPMLRVKARAGDPDPSVTGQVFDSLLRMEGQGAIPFVEDFLKWPDETVQEEAVLALGASHLAKAAAALESAWETAERWNLRETILRAMGVCGQENAMEFLLRIIRQGTHREAERAVAALELHTVPEPLRKRIAEAKQQRKQSAC